MEKAPAICYPFFIPLKLNLPSINNFFLYSSSCISGRISQMICIYQELSKHVICISVRNTGLVLGYTHDKKKRISLTYHIIWSNLSAASINLYGNSKKKHY